MIIRKLKYKISQLAKPLSRKLKNFEFNWGYWAFFIVSIVAIGVLTSNIFRIVQKGYKRYEIIQQEKERLAQLQKENRELKEELEYYSSKEFVDLKAREELNLAFPDQQLVYYVDENEEIYEIEEEESQEEEIPNWQKWRDLIF